MPVLFLLPILAGALVAAALYALNLIAETTGIEPLQAGWIALAGLGSALVALCLVALFANRRLKRNAAIIANDLARFEATIGKRLDLIEDRHAARLAAQNDKLPAVSDRSANEAVQARQNAMGTAPEPATGKGASLAEGNVIQLDPAGRIKVLREKKSRLSAQQIIDAVAQSHLDAWFQPLVSLPDRTAVYLTGHAYLALPGEAQMAPEFWLETAQSKGFGADIEHFMLVESIRLARDLARKDKKISVFWHFGRSSLAEAEKWSAVQGILKANRALTGKLVCGLDLAEYGQLSRTELDRLYQLRESGYRVALLNCNNLQALANALKSGLFAAVLADTDIIVDAARMEPVTNDGAYRAVEFMATGVKSENEVIMLIDRDIWLAQGPVFAAPKPLRRAHQAKKNPEGAA